jgi:hypothetical protein
MKVFEASVLDGVVRANGGAVPECPILGEGGNSSGYLVISESKLVYLPKTTPDVKSLIILIESLCDKILEMTMTSSAPTTPTSTPINSADFTAIKEQLTSLKEALK